MTGPGGLGCDRPANCADLRSEVDQPVAVLESDVAVVHRQLRPGSLLAFDVVDGSVRQLSRLFWARRP